MTGIVSSISFALTSVSRVAQVATSASCPGQQDSKPLPKLSAALEKHLSHEEDALDELIVQPVDLDRIQAASRKIWVASCDENLGTKWEQ